MGFLGGILMIFDGVKMGEMLDFVGFARTHYRTQNWGRGVETTDMSISEIEHLF